MILKIAHAPGNRPEVTMIVCSCRAVSDREIRMAAEAGRSLEDIVRVTGATTDCGCCAGAVERIVRISRPRAAATGTGGPDAGAGVAA